MGKLAFIFAISMLVIGMAMASVIWPSPVLLMEPGPAMDVGTMISIPDKHKGEKENIYLTSVSIRSASLVQWGMAVLDPSVRIMPREEVEPQDISPEDMRRIQVQLLEESKTVAKIVALRKLGYDVKISGQGARVEAITPDSPTQGKLEIGDTIVGVNGQQMNTATELVDAVRRLKPGDHLTLIVLRGEQGLEIPSETIESTTDPGQAMLGILITTRMFDYQLPFEVHIDTENLAGPSAGLMFTLGIVDALTPGDLTMGYKIAGTGTIALDGTVGKIDGVKQKIIGAERAGAEYYLAPEENYSDAKAAAKVIEVVMVRNVDDAMGFLSTLEERAKAEAPVGVAPSMVTAPAW